MKFIKKHDKTRHLFLVHSSIQLLLPGDTRFATAISTLERLIKVKAALVLTVKDPEWTKFKKRLPKERRDKAKRFEAAVLGKSEEGKLMWSDAAVLVGVCHPIVTVLRMADGQAPCTGEVYHFMYTLQEHISEADMGGGQPRATAGAAQHSAGAAGQSLGLPAPADLRCCVRSEPAVLGPGPRDCRGGHAGPPRCPREAAGARPGQCGLAGVAGLQGAQGRLRRGGGSCRGA